jgi:Xaa-Pro aminopeptidase
MSSELAPKEIIAQKMDQAASKLRESGVDLWITFVQETSSGAERIFSYVSPGHLTWESAIVVAADGRRWLICGNMDQQNFEQSGLYGEILTFVQDFKEPFLQLMTRLAPKSVALNYSVRDPIADGITHGRFENLKKLLRQASPGVKIVPADAIIGALISTKTDLERERVQKAVDVTVEIFKEIDAYLRPGLTEKEVYGFVEGRMASRGLKPSFETLVFMGDRGYGAGHGSATDNPLTPGDLMHVDLGVYVDGYVSDMQRTWYLRKPGEDVAPEAVQKGFKVIVKAIEACGKALKPGVKGKKIDSIARKIITKAGFPEYPHGLGHQIGRHVHDGGAMLGPAWARYRRTPFYPLEAGMIFTLEPSLNVPGHGGVGLEEDVVVTAEGAHYMAESQRELWYVKG